jgi:hypothetical protein
MASCPPIPTFVPSDCAIRDIDLSKFANPTSRAARKAILSPSLRAGQLQSSRLGALKRCVIQVNASEIAFRQASWGKVQLIDKVPTTFYTFPPALYQELTPLNTRIATFLPIQPTTQIIAYDPSGNLYTFVNNSGVASVTQYPTDASGIVVLSPSITGSAFNLPANLTSANLFWSPYLQKLIFVGIFFNGQVSSASIYTFNSRLTANPAPIQIPVSQNGRQYAGQVTCNSAGVIYIVLCAVNTFAYQTAPVFIISADLTSVKTTNLNSNYNTILQTAGDSLNGAVISSYSSIGANAGIYISYFTGAVLGWSKLLSTSASGPCGLLVIGNNRILTIYANGASAFCGLQTYTATSVQTTSIKQFAFTPPPFTDQYVIRSISLSQNQGRYYYTMYMTNLTVPNYEFYMQNGEFTVDGLVTWSVNVQIGDTYNVSPSNIIQTSPTTMTVCYGLELTKFVVGYYAPSEIPVINYGTLDISYCVVRSVKTVCPCAPKTDVSGSYDVRSSLQHTLARAICNPMFFINPTANMGCAPIYTPPTKFLTDASGAEPPLGPGIYGVTRRRFQTISGIDQICRPVPPRTAGLRTARVRANIQLQTDTRYVNTVLPVVQYPPLCPVYGNQSGIPVASLCQPAIDSRPTFLR